MMALKNVPNNRVKLKVYKFLDESIELEEKIKLGYKFIFVPDEVFIWVWQGLLFKPMGNEKHVLHVQKCLNSFCNTLGKFHGCMGVLSQVFCYDLHKSYV